MAKLPVNRNAPERLCYYHPAHPMPPGVTLAGRFRCRGATLLPEHLHQGVYELCFVAHGSMRYHYDGREVDINAGELHLCRPGMRHSGANNLLNPCVLYWCEFDPEAVLPAGGALEFFRRHPDGKLACEAPRELRGDFEALLAECGRAESADRDAAIVWRIGLMLMNLARRCQASAGEGAKHYSRPVEALIREFKSDIAGRRSLAGIMAAAGLGTSALYERFRRETGFSPHEYRLHLKIDRARELLCTSAAGVTEIAFACGFSSSQYFATVFGRITGFTPGRWRHLHLKNPS